MDDFSDHLGVSIMAVAVVFTVYVSSLSEVWSNFLSSTFFNCLTIFPICETSSFNKYLLFLTFIVFPHLVVVVMILVADLGMWLATSIKSAYNENSKPSGGFLPIHKVEHFLEIFWFH